MANKNTGYIGNSPSDSSVTIARQAYTSSGITTDFTFRSGYTPGYLDAYLNGVRLIETDDYVATDGTTLSLTTAAQNGDTLELIAYKAFNVSEFTLETEVGGDFNVSNNLTVGGLVLLKGGIVEKYENAGTTLGSQTNNPLTDGNIIYFIGNESGNNTINFTGVHSTLLNGETVSFTVIITPNNSGVINVIQIDGQEITIKWLGGSAPSASSSGQDIYKFQILKTGTGASDYIVYGSANNYS